MDLTDTSSISNLIKRYKPDEFYNLAAMSHVGISFYTGEATLNINTVASYRILESILKNHKKCKFYQASSSEMFGSTPPPQNEKSSFNPQSPYGISKVAAFHTTKYFRQAHGLFASNGILFNHESPIRGKEFVTRKVSDGVARIKLGLAKKITLGNLDAKRDWGFAGDYVDGMYKILDYSEPEDWVIATGSAHSVENFAKIAFNLIDKNYEDYIETSERYLRPNEVNYLLGDPTKANKLLNWKSSTSLEELIKLMVESDIEIATKEKMLLDNGLIKPTWENPVFN